MILSVAAAKRIVIQLIIKLLNCPFTMILSVAVTKRIASANIHVKLEYASLT